MWSSSRSKPVRILSIAVLGLAGGGLLAGCEGETFREPPIHLQQNMDFQKKFEAQEANPRFEDGRAMRAPLENTVAVGHLRTDAHLYEGKVDGEWARTLPKQDAQGKDIVLSEDWLERGKERYEIFCTPCHAYTGEGNGLAVQRGMLPPPSMYDERLQGQALGYFYDIITNGKNNMGPYRSQIPVRDRWAIASYVRVLQRSRAATLDQVPKDEAAKRGWSK